MRGGLHMLVLEGRAQNNVTDLVLQHLGTTSHPSSLVYLDDGVVYVGSSLGDSQV